MFDIHFPAFETKVHMQIFHDIITSSYWLHYSNTTCNQLKEICDNNTQAKL